MRLRPKFSLIIAINALAITLLVFVSSQNTNKLQALKDYQHVQAKTQTELSDLLLYLIQFDYQPCSPKTAYREWEEILKNLDGYFTYLNDPNNTNKLPNDITSKINETTTLWDTLKKRAEPINSAFKTMQELKYTQSDTTAFLKHGIRYAYDNYSNVKVIVTVYDNLMIVDKQLEGITTTHNTLYRLTNETTISMETYISRVEKKSTMINMIIALFAVIVTVAAVSYLTNGITKRINTVQDISSTLAKKDFSTKIKAKGNDEIAHLMENIDHMEDELKDFFIHVKNAAIKGVESGNKIEDVSSSVSEATQKIDHNIRRMTKEFEEISTSVKHTTQATEEMALQIETLVMNNSFQTAAVEESTSALNDMVLSLNNINKMAQERASATEMMHTIMQNGGQKIVATSNLLNDVTQQLDEVKAVVTLINNVAHQTNLLSMNAAIEAAHAGELGQGFSVVAEEIRSLAEETASNAKKISVVVKNIVEAVNMADESSATAKAAFEEVTVSTAQVIASLKDISGQIDSIDNKMQSVHQKSTETASAANKINANCISLSEKQDLVSNEANTMNTLIAKATDRISRIKDQTGDIVNRVNDVTEITKYNAKNMGELESMLEEFKTDVTEIIQETVAVAENNTEPAVKEELAELETETTQSETVQTETEQA